MINYMWMLVSWICFRKAMKVQNVPVGSLPFQGLATPWGPRIALSVVVIIIITNGFK
jgi:amino acid permease